MIQDDRRFPSGEEQLKDNNYKDMLYACLQMFSQWDEELQIRFINTKGPSRITVAELTKLCELSRHTIDAQLNKLEAAEYIFRKDDKIFLPKVGQFYFMIPYATLFFMRKTFAPNVIKVYTYLGRMWQYFAEGKLESSEVVFTENILIEKIGMCPTESNNHKTIRAILLNLSNNGLITYTKKVSARGNMLYLLLEVNTVIKNMPTEKVYK